MLLFLLISAVETFAGPFSVACWSAVLRFHALHGADLDASFPRKKLEKTVLCRDLSLPENVRKQAINSRCQPSKLEGDQSSDPVAVVRASADPGINLGTQAEKSPMGVFLRLHTCLSGAMKDQKSAVEP